MFGEDCKVIWEDVGRPALIRAFWESSTAIHRQSMRTILEPINSAPEPRQVESTVEAIYEQVGTTRQGLEG